MAQHGFHIMTLRALFFAFLMLCTAAQAGLMIHGSRVIYYETEKEVSVFFRNNNAYPVLVQAWLDDGDQSAAPGVQQHPFILAPGLDRVEPGKGQTIRILGTGEGDFPRDRESVLYFNLHEIPPAPSDFQGNYLQVAGRARLKFFYRPPNLPSPPELAHEGLRFALEPPESDGRTRIRVKNASPYHVTITGMRVHRPDQPDSAPPQVEFDINQSRQEGMVAPKDELVLTLEGRGNRVIANGMTLTIETKNDYGAIVRGKVALGADVPMTVQIVDDAAGVINAR